MSISFTCPHCNRTYTVNDNLAGKTLKCKQCQKFFVAPASTTQRDAVQEEYPEKYADPMQTTSDQDYVDKQQPLLKGHLLQYQQPSYPQNQMNPQQQQPYPAQQYSHQHFYERQDIGQDPGMRMLMPVGRSGYAIAAGYLGLFSLLLIPAPFAIIFGILAIKDIQKNPDKHGLGRAWTGIILGSLCAIIYLLAALF